MAVEAGQVEVPIRPRLSGFAAQIRAAAAAAGNGASVTITQRLTAGMSAAGRSAATSLAGAMQRHMPAVTRAVTSSVSQIRAGWRDAAAGASDFTSRLSRVGASAQRALSPVINSVGRFRDGFNNASAAASAFSGRMGSLGGVARRAVDSITSGLASIRGSVGRAGSSITSMASSAGGGLSSILGSAIGGVKAGLVGLGIAAAAAAAAVLKNISQMGIARLSSIENSRAALKALMGDVGQADALLQSVLNWSKGKPFQFPDLADATKKLVGVGLAAKDVIPTLEAIGTASLISGRGSQGFQQITAAMSTMLTMGRLSMGEINRLADAQIPALTILANQAGLSTDAMRKKIESGSIKSQDAIKGLVEGIKNGSKGIAGETKPLGGVLEEMGGTWTNTVESFKGYLSRTGAKIMAPLMPGMKASMHQIGGFIEQNLPAVASGFAKVFGPMITKIAPHVREFGKTLSSAFKHIKSLFDMPEIRTFGKMLLTVFGAAVIGAIKGVAMAIKIAVSVIVLGVQQSVAVWRGLAAAWSWLWDTIIGPTIDWVAGTLVPGISGAWSGLLAGLVWLRDAGGAAWSWLWGTIIGPVVGWVTGTLVPAIGAGWQSIVGGFVWLRDTAAGAWNWLWTNVIGPTVGWVTSNVVLPIWTAFDRILGFFRTLRERASAMWNGLWSGLTDAARGPVRWVVDNIYNAGIRAVWNGIAGLLGLGQLPQIQVAFATGGVVPGFAPGRDSVLAALSPGEGVLRPEVVRWLGTDWVHTVNRAARAGQLGGQFGGQLPGFADGGVVGNLAARFGNTLRGAAGGLGKIKDWMLDGLLSTVGKVLSPFKEALQGMAGDNRWSAGVAGLPIKAIDAILAKVKQWEEVSGVGKGKRVLAAAEKMIGLPYVFGAARADAVDCSGLVIMAHKVALGMSLPHSATQQYNMSKKLTEGQHRAGDIVAFAGGTDPAGTHEWGHIGIIKGGDRMIHAPTPGQNVHEASWKSMGRGTGLGRLYDQGGWLPPGWTAAYNGTGHPELILNREQQRAMASSGGGVTVNLNGSRMSSAEQAAAVGREVLWQMRTTR